MNGVRRALGVGEIRRRGRRVQVDDVLVAGDAGDRQTDARGGHVDVGVDLVDVRPLPGNVAADVRLVLVIGRDDLDLPALLQQAGIFDRHLRCDHRAWTADVRIKARLVAETSDLDVLVQSLGTRCARGKQCSREHKSFT